MKNGYLLCALVSLVFMACSDSNSPSKNTENSFGAEPTDLAFSGVDSIIMGAPGVYYNLEGGCSEDGLYEIDTARSTSYLIQEGSLYLLEGDDCQARILSGGNTSIAGKWTFNGQFQNMPGTEPQSEFECDSPSSTDGGMTGTMEFSATQIHYNMTIHNFCWAQLSAYTNEESGDSMTMVTCDSLIWKREGKQASLKLISFEVGDAGNTTVFRFDYQGASCTRHKADYLKPNPERCVQAYQVYQQNGGFGGFDYWSYSSVFRTDLADQAAYNACLEGVGFSVSGYEPGQ